MGLARTLKNFINVGLAFGNAKLESLTAERKEQNRLQTIESRGHFSTPIFPLPPSYQQFELTPTLAEIASHRGRFDTFADPAKNDVGYSFDNDYFPSPDAEVLYSMTARLSPRQIIEVGSGNSTKLFRQAIIDHKLNAQLISIDPEPRTEIRKFADACHTVRVEDLDADGLFASLVPNDILFIDSSHILATHSDVNYLFGEVLPALSSGVVVHVHDIFIPFEYPKYWVMDERYPFNEQYLVYAILMHSNCWRVLWPGYYLQQTMPDFDAAFPHRRKGNAQSLWLQKREPLSALAQAK